MKCQFPQAFNKRNPDVVHPCGGCMPCRYNKRRITTNRLLCERAMHADAAFLTCTYRDDALPGEFFHPETGEAFAPLSVNPEHHRLFKTKFQTYALRKFGRHVRFYGVGEYGEKTGRPHYHYALFNFPHCPHGGGRTFAGKYHPCLCQVCSFLQSCWPHGHIHVGNLEHDSCQYIAGYLDKKMTRANTDFQRDYLKGRHPEFVRGPRRPGLGAGYIEHIADALRPYGPFTIDTLPRVLEHGPKILPLGRYMQDKLLLALNVPVADGEKLARYRSSLRSLFTTDPSISESLKTTASLGTPHSLALALEMLNAQSSINLETRLKLFKKEKSL